MFLADVLNAVLWLSLSVDESQLGHWSFEGRSGGFHSGDPYQIVLTRENSNNLCERPLAGELCIIANYYNIANF